MMLQAWGLTTDSLDWYQTGIGRPDLALKDLASIITPTAIDASENFETHFFRNLATGELTKVSTAISDFSAGCGVISSAG